MALAPGTSVLGGPITDVGRGKSGRATTIMHLRVDLAALRRGRLEDGEVCEIPGWGRCRWPLPWAQSAMQPGGRSSATGSCVTTVWRLGRAVPAHVRSALEDRDEKCEVPGCDVAKGLEIDRYVIAYDSRRAHRALEFYGGSADGILSG